MKHALDSRNIAAAKNATHSKPPNASIMATGASTKNKNANVTDRMVLTARLPCADGALENAGQS